jgi:simple sugar transport system ATP-binding protein
MTRDAGRPEGQARPVVEMIGVSKRFLDVVANEEINLVVREGEICSLLGENGAGKTTLMNILFGYYSADEGMINLNGEKISLSSPKDAIRHGIAMVHQHFTLVPSQTVLENVIVGSAGNSFFLDIRGAREKLLKLGERFGLRVDPDARVWTLPIGGRQKVEILKALFRNARILILDEPTAVLSPPETEELFKTLRALADEGRSVIFISHKLNEVMEISDRVLILRNGRLVDERRTCETDASELAELMVGREMDNGTPPPSSPDDGETLLEIRELRVDGDMGLETVRGVDLDIRSGMITALAGVSGNGQMELSEAIFGVRSPKSGWITLCGKRLPDGRPRTRIEGGMARIPEDRMTTGLLLELSVEDNLILENHENFVRLGVLDYRAADGYSEDLLERFGVKSSGIKAQAQTLSGGNLQKLILARELDGNPRVIVAAQPTRGLDVGAIEFVHGRILDARNSGAAVLLISEDLDEVFKLSDRIAVIYEGKIMGEMPANEATRETIGLLMSGVNVLCA